MYIKNFNDISKEEVKHIAKLARLGITPKEEEKFSGELSSILNYMGKLQEVDVSKVETATGFFDEKNIMRKDEAKSCDDESKKMMIEQAPESHNRHIKVKSVF